MGHLVGLRQLTRLLALLLVLAPTAPSAATDAADAGFPSSVVVFSNGSATELWAAAKLAELLSIPLVQHPAGLPTVTRRSSLGPVALVGFQAATSLGGVPAASLSADVLPGDDSYFLSVLTSGDDDDDGGVVIASSASSRRGTMNGIFAFLRAVGFRFLTSNATVVPPKPWALPPAGWDTPRTFTPPLEQRDMDTSTAADLGRRQFVGDKTGNNFSIYWPPSNYSASVGLDGFFAFAPVGGRVAQANWGWNGLPNGGRAGYVATAYDLLCESLVADTSDCAGEGTHDPHPHNSPCLGTWRQHPEWFVCKPVTCDAAICPFVYPCTLAEVNRTFNSQPCWSNTSLQKAMAASILRILRKNPTATSISVTGMDGSPAECPPDSVANKEENSTGGANFRAIQSIGAIVNKDFPRVKLQTLAYQGSLEPPKLLRFGRNVVVQLAAPINKFVPLTDPKNEKVLELVKAWTAVTPTLYIWDYTCNFENTIIPFGNYFVQSHHIKELAALGVKGYYGEGCPHPGVDMIDIKTYLAARTAFDPSLDTQSLVVDFTEHFYSEAASPHVIEYMEIMAISSNSSDSTLDYNGNKLVGDPSRHMGITNAIYGNRTMLRAAAALAAAQRAAAAAQPPATAVQQLRLKQAMLNVLWVILLRWDGLQQFAATNAIPWPLPPTKAAAYDDFATGLTFAFEVDEPSVDTLGRAQPPHPYFTAHLPVAPGSSRYTSIACDLACFKAQLGLP